MVYCISYDLNSPGRDYSSLIDGIKSYGTWWHHLDSTWFIVTEHKTASEIRNELGQLIDTNDEILVFKVGNTWAGKGFSKRGFEY